jgi:hypothetical protein
MMRSSKAARTAACAVLGASRHGCTSGACAACARVRQA